MQYYQEAIALGSKTGLSLVSNEKQAFIVELYRDLWKEIFLFERRFSRFLPGSELSAFNRNAGTKQAISKEFQNILNAARELSDITGGLFNPFVLPALQAVGYSHSRVPGHEQDLVDDHSYKSVTTIDRLEIGNGWARIPYGTAIDLGGCGKGYLADYLKHKLPSFITGYWLSLGGDIAIGGLDEDKQPWTVAIESADEPDTDIAKIKAQKINGIATSGTTIHRGKNTGKAWHHIIDPRTQRPAKTDVLLATVCDNSSLRADVFASCAVIMGGRQGARFLKAQGVNSFILQCRGLNDDTSLLQFGDNIKLGSVHA